VSAPPDPAAPAPAGPRIEQAVLTLRLLLDLATTPFHLALFVFTRSRHRRALQRALEESAP
jgi:hypothetical protein